VGVALDGTMPGALWVLKFSYPSSKRERQHSVLFLFNSTDYFVSVILSKYLNLWLNQWHEFVVGH